MLKIRTRLYSRRSVKINLKAESDGGIGLISINDLSKEFNGIKALDGVSLSIAKGETFGLIGPNGAGKTTLIRILTGQIAPTRGEILLDGEPVDPLESRYRLRVGLVPQEPRSEEHTPELQSRM